MNHNKIIDAIRQVVIDAGNIMLSASQTEMQIAEKTSAKDLVTRYDKLIQEEMISAISSCLKSARFVSEELEANRNICAEDTIIIDPIDGTTNFIHALGNCAISVAWYKLGRPFYGVVYDPFVNELYEAKLREGAFMNGRPIHVRNAPLKSSVVVFGTAPYNAEMTDITFDLVKMVYGKCQDVRRMGSAALDICHVASGRAGLYFEAALSLWDYAAAALILAESGGSMVDFSGLEIVPSVEKTAVIAGHKDIIAESKIIERVKSVWTAK